MYNDDPQKDPNDVLDYKTDFANTTNGGNVADFLNVGETIDSVVVTADAGINVHDGVTVYNSAIRAAPTISGNGTLITFWLSGGTHLTNYTVTVTITTSDTRIIERSRRIAVRQQ